jgi:hypothetical protein
MRIAMPSPRNTNHERLFIERPAGAAYDSAPGGPPVTKMVRWLMQQGVADEDIDEFLRRCHEQPTEDDLEKGETYAGENQIREAMQKDGMPRAKHAMDEHPTLGIVFPEKGFG